MKNVTLSMPDDLLQKSRAYAQKHGTTLNQMIRDLLKKHIEKEGISVAEAIVQYAKKTVPSKVGYKWNREDAYLR